MTQMSNPDEVERLLHLLDGEPRLVDRLDDCVRQLREVQAAKAVIAGLDSGTRPEVMARRRQRLAAPGEGS